MLTPEYLAGCTSYLLGMMDELDRAIIADIARRIVKTGSVTPTAKDQAEKLQQSGMLMTDVIQQVAVTANKTDEEIAQLFKDASVQGLQNDVRPLVLAGQKVDVRLSPAMQQILQASIDKTNGDVRNLSMTLGSTAANKYIEAVNAATMKVQSGAFSYAQAIRDAVKEAADDGNWVTYNSGHRDRLDVAIRRSVLTGVNQTTAKLTEMNAEALGAEYYETTAHAGARPSHSVWQGRVFKIHGETAEYPNFEDKTGYGTGAGLCGWNCRHSFYPFWPGISVPAYTQEMLDSYKEAKFSYNGKKMTEYEVSQEMRGMERDIRETKREIAGLQAAYDAAEDPKLKADLKADLEKASVRLKHQEAKYRDLCKQTSHKPDTVRTGVTAFKDEKGNILSFNQSAAQRARQTAEKSYQQRIKDTGADDFAPKTLAKRNEMRYNNKEESGLLERYMRQVEKGTISPLTGFGNYSKQYHSVQDSIVGTTTSNGIEISGQTKHFVDRVVGGGKEYDRQSKEYHYRSGVEVDDARDALLNPVRIGVVKIDKSGKPSQKFVGKKATVSVNPDTKEVIQCNPTSSKLTKQKGV